MKRAVIVAVVYVGAVAAADSLAPADAWTQKIDGSDLTLSSSKAEWSRGGAGAATLTLSRDGKTVWSVSRPYLYRGQALVATDGSYTALFDEKGFTLLDAEGHEKGAFSVLDQLADEEKSLLTHSVSHVMWLEGARFDLPQKTLELSVSQRGQLPPMYQSPNKSLPLQFHLDTLTFTRPKPITIDSLIASYASARQESDRVDVLGAILERAGWEKTDANPKVASFFLTAAKEPGASAERIAAAAEGVARFGTDADVRGLGTLTGHDVRTDVSILEAMDRHHLPEAVELALSLVKSPKLTLQIVMAADQVLGSRAKDPRVDSALLTMLRAGDGRFRAETCRGIRAPFPDDLLAAIVHVASTDSDSGARLMARSAIESSFENWNNPGEAELRRLRAAIDANPKETYARADVQLAWLEEREGKLDSAARRLESALARTKATKRDDGINDSVPGLLEMIARVHALRGQAAEANEAVVRLPATNTCCPLELIDRAEPSIPDEYACRDSCSGVRAEIAKRLKSGWPKPKRSGN